MVVAQKRRQGVGVDRSRRRQGDPGELSISERRFSNHRSSDREDDSRELATQKKMTVFEKRRRRRRKQAGKRKTRWEAKARQATHHQQPAHAPSCKRIGCLCIQLA